MINLLPPETKKQVHFARLNRSLRRYAFLVISVAALLSAILITGNMVNQYFTKDIEEKLSAQEKAVSEYKDVEAKAKEIDSQIKKVSSVLDKTTRYSAVLQDIAKNLPSGSKIAGLNLTGSIKEPLIITVLSQNEKSALAIEPSLEKMERFSFVDIQTFTETDEGFQVDLVLTFANAEGATQ